MSRNQRKPKSRPSEPGPTAAETAGGVLFFAGYAIRKTPWYVWALLAAVPVAGYIAYPYYQAWAIWDSTFETQVYNMNDEVLGNMLSIPYDYEVRIGTAGVNPNSMQSGNDDYTNTRKVTFSWDFESIDHGHTLIEKYSQRTCYFKTLELPERKKGENTLQIGVYGKDVLRIRWNSNNWTATDMLDGKYIAADAWQHGSIPLSSNWRKKAPTNWPEKTTWNEAVDGPAIDAKGAGAWLTAKADRAEPCKENE